MAIRVITWNMYYGDLQNPNSTPVIRLNHIAQVAANNQVDAVFLQEHPAATSQYVDQTGLLLNRNIPIGYSYNVFREYVPAPNMAPATNIIRSYAVLLRTATTQPIGQVGYYNQLAFTLNNGLSYLRAPIGMTLRKNNVDYNFFTWHNETGVVSNQAMQIFAQLIGHNPAIQNSVLLGDLNINTAAINQIPTFNQWNHVTVDQYHVDHILTRLRCNPAIGNQLDFLSDANHHPIAADIG